MPQTVKNHQIPPVGSPRVKAKFLNHSIKNVTDAAVAASFGTPQNQLPWFDIKISKHSFERAGKIDCPIFFGFGVHNSDSAARQINMLPSKVHYFASPHAGIETEHGQVIDIFGADFEAGQKSFRFFPGQKTGTAIVSSRQNNMGSGISPLIKTPFCHKIVDTSELPYDMSNCGWGLSFFQEFSLYFFYILRFYGRQRVRTKGWSYMRIIPDFFVFPHGQVASMTFFDNGPSLIQSIVSGGRGRYFNMSANILNPFGADLIGEGCGISFRSPSDFFPFALAVKRVNYVPSQIGTSLMTASSRLLAEDPRELGFSVARHVHSPGVASLAQNCLRFAYGSDSPKVHSPGFLSCGQKSHICLRFAYASPKYKAFRPTLPRTSYRFNSTLYPLFSRYFGIERISRILKKSKKTAKILLAVMRSGVRSPSAPPGISRALGNPPKVLFHSGKPFW